MKGLNNISKFLALVLRHKPQEIGITLDEHGWAKVNSLLKGMGISMDVLEEIVRTDNKQRYSFNENKTLIRANQGHSIPVDVELEKKTPPEVLYHGTGVKYLDSIKKQGLLPKSRLYVHLSSDPLVAMNVGKRHGTPVILVVRSKDMSEDGFEFFLSSNGVWLTKEVPVKYLSEKDSIA